MELILLIARLMLAAVFGVAGGSKLGDRDGARKALIEFGVPESLTALLAWLLPATELLVAITLLPRATAWLGGVGALALLLLFLVGIGVNLARGNSPDCHCFGQLHSEPVSWSVFARNGVLAALAALIVAQGKDNPGLSAVSWMSELSTGEIVSLVFSVFAAAMLVPAFVMLRRVLKQQTALLETVTAMKKLIDEDYAEPEPVEREDALPPVEGLPVGAMAPAFSLPAFSGGQVSLDDLLACGKSVLLLFVSPTCSPCKTLLPMLKVWEREYGAYLTIALVSKGALEENRKKMAKYDARYLLLQEESKIADEYQARWTPAAVLVNRVGKIASPVSSGEEAIKALVHHTVTTLAAQPAANGANGHIPQIAVGTSLFKVGEPAPRFSLPDLRGKNVNLEELLGQNTLLLFWDPLCPHCQAMSEDLKRWEETPPKGAPRLVYISSGNIDETMSRHRELKSWTLLDEDFDIGPLFGTNSTPSAVLIDGEGRIASTLAKGARNILALAGIRRVELPIVNGLHKAS
jgi:peroxiredoxin